MEASLAVRVTTIEISNTEQESLVEDFKVVVEGIVVLENGLNER